MRIGIVIDDFFPASGGIGRSVQTQLEELVKLGHEPILIAPDRYLEKPRIARVIECPTVYVKGMPAHLSVLHCTERRAELISGRAQFDVIHSQTERGALILAARIARMQSIPHVHTFHANIAGTHQTIKVAVFGTLSYLAMVNPLLTVASKRRPSRAHLPRRELETGGLAARMDWVSFADIAGKVDAYTVPSPFMRDLIEEAALVHRPGFIVASGCNQALMDVVAATPRQRTDGRFRFLSIGRLAKEKRLDVLIKAFLSADVPDAELVIVGDGDQRRSLQALAGGDPRIDFRGHISAVDRIGHELVNADVLALTSYRFDSQGLVITEAVSAGVPVLYCDDRLTVGLSPRTALLTGPDIRSIAQGIRKLCDRDLLDAMSAATADLLPDLSPRSMAERYVEVYDYVIAMKRSARA